MEVSYQNVVAVPGLFDIHTSHRSLAYVAVTGMPIR